MSLLFDRAIKALLVIVYLLRKNNAPALQDIQSAIWHISSPLSRHRSATLTVSRLSSKRLLGITDMVCLAIRFFLGSAYRQYALLRKTALNQRLAWELEPFMSTFVEAVIALKYNHVQGPEL